MTASKIYTRTAGQIIEEALRDARIIPAEQPIQAVDYENGLDALNNVSKFWQTKGVHLWLEERAVLPLNPGQQVYLMGPDGDPCGYREGFVETDVGADASQGATALTVVSSEGMEPAPDILESDPTDSTQDWTATNATLSTSSGLRVTNSGAAAGSATYELEATIGQTYRVRFGFTLGTSVSATISVLNGATVEDSVLLSASGASNELVITAAVDPIVFKIANTSTTVAQYSTVYDLQYVDDIAGSRIGVELDDGTMQWNYVLNVNSATSIDLTNALDDDAAENNQIFSFTTQIDRPLRLSNFMYSSAPGSSGVPVNKWSRQEYMQQPQKNAQGSVVNWYYNPTLDDGRLYVWQTANNIQNTLEFDVRKPLSVYSQVSDILDYPSEAYLPLKWGIAADLGPQYGVKEARQTILEQKAFDHFESWQGSDNEESSMMITPDYSGG
jgi:3D (Asp-Asp-Asp) domain-containing protein